MKYVWFIQFIIGLPFAIGGVHYSEEWMIYVGAVLFSLWLVGTWDMLNSNKVKIINDSRGQIQDIREDR